MAPKVTNLGPVVPSKTSAQSGKPAQPASPPSDNYSPVGTGQAPTEAPKTR